MNVQNTISLDRIRLLADQKAIREVRIEPAEVGYVVVVNGMVFCAARGTPRQFKKLDTLVEVLKSAGIARAEIEFERSNHGENHDDK